VVHRIRTARRSKFTSGHREIANGGCAKPDSERACTCRSARNRGTFGEPKLPLGSSALQPGWLTLVAAAGDRVNLAADGDARSHRTWNRSAAALEHRFRHAAAISRSYPGSRSIRVARAFASITRYGKPSGSLSEPAAQAAGSPLPVRPNERSRPLRWIGSRSRTGRLRARRAWRSAPPRCTTVRVSIALRRHRAVMIEA